MYFIDIQKTIGFFNVDVHFQMHFDLIYKVYSPYYGKISTQVEIICNVHYQPAPQLLANYIKKRPTIPHWGIKKN